MPAKGSAKSTLFIFLSMLCLLLCCHPARPSILSYPALRPTLMAIAIAQLMCMTAAYAAAEPEAAVNADAQAQPLQEVVVSGNKSAQKPDHTKVTGFIDQKLIDTPF